MKGLFFKIKQFFSNLFKSKEKYFSIDEVKNNYFILRHGHTKYTAELRETIYPQAAHFELGITEKGKQDIEKLIPALKQKNIDIIISSDYLRTRITSRIVAESLDLKINFDKRLRDVNLGIYRGRKKHEFYNALSAEEMFFKGPKGGESWLDCVKRLEEVIKDLEKRYKDKNILIVSHGDPLWLLEKGIANKNPIDQLLEERSIPKPGELRKLNFK